MIPEDSAHGTIYVIMHQNINRQMDTQPFGSSHCTQIRDKTIWEGKEWNGLSQ